MPASFDSLDMQLNTWRDGYKRAISFGNWDLAIHFVILFHSSVPPPARIKEFRPFKIRARTTSGAMLDYDRKAESWCKFWMAKIEISLSNNREKIIKYLRDGGF